MTLSGEQKVISAQEVLAQLLPLLRGTRRGAGWQ